MKQNHNPRPLEETRRYWPIMTAYERFEQIVAFLLGLLIAVVVVIALIQLLMEVMPYCWAVHSIHSTTAFRRSSA
jgi:uncharacterized protein involved in cysteine biosynthesis